MAGTGTAFDFSVRVYYEDTDAGGVVFYANYLKFFERARTEWLRALGVSQQSLRAHDGVLFVVASTTVDYHAPAQLDDLLRIRSRIVKMGRVALTFEQQAWRLPAGRQDVSNCNEGELLATGQIKVACVKPEVMAGTVVHGALGTAQNMRPTALPAAIREGLMSFESLHKKSP